MGYNNSANKTFTSKFSKKIIDTVCFNNRYIDLETVKEKATGIVSVVMIFACIVAFSFLFLV